MKMTYQMIQLCHPLVTTTASNELLNRGSETIASKIYSERLLKALSSCRSLSLKTISKCNFGRVVLLASITAFAIVEPDHGTAENTLLVRGFATVYLVLTSW
jgi:hypothetical protein